MAAKDIIRRLALALLPPLYKAATGLLFATCQVREEGRPHYELLRHSGRPFLAAIWHYSLLYIIHRMPGHEWVAMVSGSKDGDYIAKLLQSMGFTTVRGSRHRGGVGALKGMLAQVREGGKNAAIVADGSQGPPRRLQAGVLLLSARSGAPILPVAWAADRFWVFKSWDRTVLPKPFARLAFHYGAPYSVPAENSTEELEEHRQRLEERLNALYRQAWGEFKLVGHGDGAA